MIPPDHEIYEVEKRIAARRHRVETAARETGRQAIKALASPWALAGAGIIGFFLAGGLRKGKLMRMTPPRVRITFIHPDEVARALAMAADEPRALNKPFLFTKTL